MGLTHATYSPKSFAMEFYSKEQPQYLCPICLPSTVLLIVYMYVAHFGVDSA